MSDFGIPVRELEVMTATLADFQWDDLTSFKNNGFLQDKAQFISQSPQRYFLAQFQFKVSVLI